MRWGTVGFDCSICVSGGTVGLLYRGFSANREWFPRFPKSPPPETHNAQWNGWTRAVKLTKNLVKADTTSSLHLWEISGEWTE